jgi:hypothetical protein
VVDSVTPLTSQYRNIDCIDDTINGAKNTELKGGPAAHLVVKCVAYLETRR